MDMQKHGSALVQKLAIEASHQWSDRVETAGKKGVPHEIFWGPIQKAVAKHTSALRRYAISA
eukprot:9893624-Prorocentrum_lima.AAC.1